MLASAVSEIPLARSPLLKILVLAIGLSLGSPFPLLGQSMTEHFLREKVRHFVMPHYPESSIANGTSGVAVVRLLINKRGRTVEADVLQAPDDKISESVVHAVLQWIFEPTSNHRGELTGVRSKLTFYFVLKDDGSALVLNPDDVRELRGQ